MTGTTTMIRDSLLGPLFIRSRRRNGEHALERAG